MRTTIGSIWPRWRILLVAAAAVSILVAAVLIVWWPQTTELERFAQPDTITYSDGFGHAAILRRHHSMLTSIGFANESYDILFGVTDGRISYGHTVDVDFTGADPSDITVEWEPDGAWINYATGHRVFVPEEAFTGLR